MEWTLRVDLTVSTCVSLKETHVNVFFFFLRRFLTCVIVPPPYLFYRSISLATHVDSFSLLLFFGNLIGPS